MTRRRMHVLTLVCDPEDAELLSAELYALGVSGIIEEDRPGGRIELRAFFPAPFDAGDFQPYSPRWEEANSTNWARKIMDEWDPICVGERFFITPDWRADPTPPGRLRLEVRPGVALGTGYHPTTQMCIEALERYLEPGGRIFDLGCGTGVLSHAAWLLGARRIIASDVDPQATQSAVENLARAGVPALLFTGSSDAMRPQKADLMIANISPEVVIDLRDEIRRLLPRGGRAVLSGFPAERADEVALAYETGFSILERTVRGEWAAMVIEVL